MHGIGGMEVVAWDLARQFAQRGSEVTVLTTCIDRQEPEFIQDGVRVVAIRDAPSRRYSRAWWSGTRSYFSQQCDGSISAVLSVSTAAIGVLGFKAAMPGVPFVLQAHGTSWGEAVSKWKTRKLSSIVSSVKNLAWLPTDLNAYRKFDAVVGVGERVFHDLRRPPVSWVLPHERVHLITNGIDAELFTPSNSARTRVRTDLEAEDDDPIIISATRLHAQKGVSAGLNAFAEFLKPNPRARFLIAGDGPERANLEAQARELGVLGNVRFLGGLRRSVLVKYLQASDVFLFLTSRIEGLPLNVLEALACGLPAVISDHLEIFDSPDICEVDPRVPQDGCAALTRMLVRKRAASSKSMLPQDYTLTVAAARYVSLLERLG